MKKLIMILFTIIICFIGFSVLYKYVNKKTERYDYLNNLAYECSSKLKNGLKYDGEIFTHANMTLNRMEIHQDYLVRATNLCAEYYKRRNSLK